MRDNGKTIYDGPSLIDGKPIVAILTGLAIASANKKTGEAPLQTWILSRDLDPIVAVASGADRSICGDCQHRGHIESGPRNVGRSCYVEYHAAVRNLWLAYQRGKYPAVPMMGLPILGHQEGIRLGSYGDPAAVPSAYWEFLTSRAAWFTGYTHDWRRCSSKMRAMCMASVDSEEERREARLAGWRTFRVRTRGSELGDYEIVCPASEEGGHRLTCGECRACSGNGGRARADVAIIAHGAPGRWGNFERRQTIHRVEE